MSNLSQLKDEYRNRLLDPDSVGESEYRLIHDWVFDMIENAETDNESEEGAAQMVEGSLDEIVESVYAVKKALGFAAYKEE